MTSTLTRRTLFATALIPIVVGRDCSNVLGGVAGMLELEVPR